MKGDSGGTLGVHVLCETARMPYESPPWLQVGGFIPSFSSGTFKTRATTQPPVSSQALWQVAKRWGVQKTRWALELLFDDLFVQVSR